MRKEEEEEKRKKDEDEVKKEQQIAVFFLLSILSPCGLHSLLLLHLLLSPTLVLLKGFQIGLWPLARLTLFFFIYFPLPGLLVFTWKNIRQPNQGKETQGR